MPIRCRRVFLYPRPSGSFSRLAPSGGSKAANWILAEETIWRCSRPALAGGPLAPCATNLSREHSFFHNARERGSCCADSRARRGHDPVCWAAGRILLIAPPIYGADRPHRRYTFVRGTKKIRSTEPSRILSKPGRVTDGSFRRSNLRRAAPARAGGHFSEAISNDDVPFEDVVEELKPPTDPS
jgi:hypothetical protein